MSKQQQQSQRRISLQPTPTSTSNEVHERIVDIIASGNYDSHAIALALAKKHPAIFVQLHDAGVVTKTAPADPRWAGDVASLLRSGGLISAIKMVRENTKLGLKEAKNIVDAARSNSNSNGLVAESNLHYVNAIVAAWCDMSDLALFERNCVDVCNQAFTSFKQEIQGFLDGPYPNHWVYGDDIISVYTRKAHHAISGALIQSFDIGTITVSEQFRGRGLGMRVINHMHQINPFRCTYVESILNEGLYDRLIDEGWRDVPGSKPKSVFKMTPLTKKLGETDS